MATTETTTDIPARLWHGRDDGPGADHLRWYRAVNGTRADGAGDTSRSLALVGFRSDEGVRRNHGRPGAAAGPDALRRALASLALPASLAILDTGDVAVTGGDLEGGQRRLGAVITPLLDAGRTVFVLGGGHEVAYGSYLGLAASRPVREGLRLGVLNLDAHFDLRDDPVPSSGTPFLQMACAEERAGRRLDYRVLGVSRASNTQRLFRTAERLGVRHLADTECGLLDLARVREFVGAFLDDCDLVHLSIDLDVLPAATAPGVSAPAARGVPMEVVEAVCAAVAASGKLALCDVAELNPVFDLDDRTARTAARLLHTMATAQRALGR